MIDEDRSLVQNGDNNLMVNYFGHSREFSFEFNSTGFTGVHIHPQVSNSTSTLVKPRKSKLFLFMLKLNVILYIKCNNITLLRILTNINILLHRRRT